MYFYFGISWVITNWKFVFSLLFVEQESVKVLKLYYLISFYPVDTFGVFLWSISKLIFIPLLSSYIFVWYFSQLSEKFYKRNETFKMNKEAIKRGLEYDFKKKEKIEDIELRELEVEKKVVDYRDNLEFNDNYDSLNEIIRLSGSTLLPSRVLYDSDYDLYIESLNDYNLTKDKT